MVRRIVSAFVKGDFYAGKLTREVQHDFAGGLKLRPEGDLLEILKAPLSIIR